MLIIAYENDENAKLVYIFERTDCSGGNMTEYTQFKFPIVNEGEIT
jgi:hypothetical protein